MRNTLLIRIGPDPADDCHWLPLDGDGQAVGMVRTGTLAEAAVEANGLRVTVLLPGLDCLLARASIPGRNRQKLLRAVPYLLEEQLTDDVEDLHFALGPLLPEGDYPVVVVSIRRMDAVLQAFAAAGLEISQLLPDLLAIPFAEDGTSAVIAGDVALVRTGPWSGFAVDTDNLGLMLASQPLDEDESARPVHIRAPAGSSLPELPATGLELDVEYYNGDVLNVLARGLVTPSIDLLQGAYSRTQEWGRLWRPWRATAALLLAGFLLSNVAMGVDYYRLKQQQDMLNSEIEAVFRQAFPGVKRVVNPRVQMQQQLEQLQRRQGGGGQILLLVSRSGDVLRNARDVRITGASFRAGHLDVDLNVANLQVLDELKQTLSGKGLSVEIQSAAADADRRVKSRLRIEGRGA
jgi:general secretion pathway protein L